jgi:Tol biopolymer transport system component
MTRRIPIVWALSASLWIAAGQSGFVTVAQGDPGRSPRAARMVDVSASGRYIAFESWVPLAPADDDQNLDIYVLDRVTGRVTLESGDLGAECSHARISADGRYVVFEARIAVALGDYRLQIALRDRSAVTTKILTTAGDASTADGWSRNPDISDDGRLVTFSSAATSLVGGPDANGRGEDVYTYDVSTGVIARVSVSPSGMQFSNGTSILPALSSDGRWIVFASTAPLDSPADPAARESPFRQVYLRDLSTGTTIRASRSPRGAAADGDSAVPALSGNGLFVTFASDATNLVGNDGNRSSDVFLFDREKDAIVLVSRSVSGSSAAGLSTNPSISADGRLVAFQSDAANLVCASRCSPTQQDINLLWDTFVYDRVTAKTTRMSEDALGGWMDPSAGISIDATGAVVAFSSRHPRDASDRGDDVDLFVRTLDPPPFASRAR